MRYLILAICLPFFILGCAASKTGKIPKPINDKIEEFKKQAKKNPPVKVYQYTYQDKKVYFFTSYCCDIMSTVYDEKGNLICSPDGGFTGKGDGKCADFFEKRSEEKLIWEDKR